MHYRPQYQNPPDSQPGLIHKRKQYITTNRGEEKGMVQLQKQRVRKQFEKHIEQKTLSEVIPEDVVEFLIFKEIERKGSTVVHTDKCEYIGTKTSKIVKKEECGFRHAYDSLRSGYSEELK